MARRDNFGARSNAINQAIRGLEAWRRQWVTKGLWDNQQQWGIWPHEYKHIRQTTKLLRNYLESLKGEDTRIRE